MTARIPSVLMLAIVTVQLGVVLLFLNRMVTGHWWGRPGSRRAVRTDLGRLRRDIVHLVNRCPHLPSPDADGADALFARLDTIEQGVKRGKDASAAEAVQCFQWEVLKARVQGSVSRETATRLIDDAQQLCEDLRARERVVSSKTPSASG